MALPTQKPLSTCKSAPAWGDLAQGNHASRHVPDFSMAAGGGRVRLPSLIGGLR
jgi:hypothetical protein